MFVMTHTFVVTKHVFCHDKTFVVTKLCLSRQNFCHDKNTLSRQTYFCRDKRHVLSLTNTCLSWQTCVCRDKTFVATKIILVAAPANNIQRVTFTHIQTWKPACFERGKFWLLLGVHIYSVHPALVTLPWFHLNTIGQENKKQNIMQVLDLLEWGISFHSFNVYEFIPIYFGHYKINVWTHFDKYICYLCLTRTLADF